MAGMRFLPALLALLLIACDSPKPVEKTPVKEVRNDTLLLPATDQVSVRVVQDHVLGEAKLPGGTFAEYESKGKKYQLFVIRTDGNQDAALLLLTAKSLIENPEYIAHMGGYAGTYKGAPFYTFAKLQFLAGVAGLPKDEADTVARQFAAKIK